MAINNRLKTTGVISNSFHATAIKAGNGLTIDDSHCISISSNMTTFVEDICMDMNIDRITSKLSKLTNAQLKVVLEQTENIRLITEKLIFEQCT